MMNKQRKPKQGKKIMSMGMHVKILYIYIYIYIRKCVSIRRESSVEYEGNNHIIEFYILLLFSM